MSLEVVPLAIPDVKLIMPKRFGDARGVFHESWQKERYEAAGLVFDFVQDNLSFSKQAGTIRGLHFQRSPFAQTKLVMVPQGRIFDVAVDLRENSPTFGKWVSTELSSEDGYQLLVPQGFAHGFCTLESDTTVLYKVDAYYSPKHEGGIIWSDPELGINWPVDDAGVVLSAKDSILERFSPKVKP